jgi:Spy/CpxP family protein refolding chaperone
MTRIIVISGFLIAFVAGAISGIAWTHRPAGGPEGDRRSRDSWIAKELSLTPDQQTQMKEIWSEMSGGHNDSRGKRDQVRRQRDEAIAALIPEASKAALDAIHQSYRQQMEELEAEGRKRFEKAVEKTKKILTAEQLKKCEELLTRGPGPGRGRDRPSTRPTTQKQ